MRVSAGTTTALGTVRMRPIGSDLFARAATSPAVATGRASRAVSISGTVRNRAGTPLKGICVWVYPPGKYFSGVGVATSRNGTYSSVDLAAGRYLVMFTTHCGNLGNYAPQFWKRAATPAGATVLALKPGQHATHIDGRLGPGGSLAGTVRSATTGQGVGGICVWVTSVTQPVLYQFRVITKRDGSYRLTGLASGKYKVRFTPDCGTTGSYLPVTLPGSVSVTAGKLTRHVNASLPAGAEITGIVTDSGGQPVPGICIWENGNYTAATTGKDGSYAIRGLDAGRYAIGFVGGCGNSGSYAPQFYPGVANPAAATWFSVIGGEVRSGTDATLLPGGSVTGVVTNQAGQTISGACVLLATPSSFEDPGINFGMPWIFASELDGWAQSSNGHYAIRNLPPGAYYAEFGSCDSTRYANQWFRARPDIQAASQIFVPAGVTTTGISAALRLGGSISGTIRNAAGRGLSGVCATAQDLAGPDPFSSPPQARSRSGTYQITGLPPGRYAVQFGPCWDSQEYAAQWYPAAVSEASATPVTVRAGRTSPGISTTLVRGGSVSGRVISAVTGKPPRGWCFVYAMDAAENQVGLGVTIGKDGSYLLPHLRSGTYTIAACGYPGLDKGVIIRRVTVSGSRARTGVNVTLPRMGSIAGQVLAGATAAPAPAICVSAVPVTGPGGPGLATTGPAGRYVIRGLAPGTYQVQFSAVCVGSLAALAQQWYLDQLVQSSATPVTVTSGQQHAGINAVLAADGGISGTVTDAASAAPIPGVCVTAAGTGPLSGLPPVIAESAGDGSYLLGDVPPGSYRVRFSAGCGMTGYATQWYSGASSPGSATLVTVTAGETSPDINAGLQH